jgi:hypothetical protein
MKKFELRQIIKEEIQKTLNENDLEPYKVGKSEFNSGYKLTKAPNPDELLENVKYIDSFLDLSRSKITTLPDNLTIDGYLALNNTKITNLPKGLVVLGDLELLNCKYLSSFPSDLVVGGNMVLNSKKFNKEELKKQLPNVNYIIIMS